jgi:hypothetical protein
MYTTSLLGQAAVGAAASLTGLRAQLTALTFGCALLSEAEQLRANHNIHECEDIGRLTRWLVNTRRELERRAMRQELVAEVAAPVVNASGAVEIKVLALVNMVPALLGPYNETPTSIRYATTEQKEQILALLRQPHITRPQKTKALLRLNSLTSSAASLLLLQLTLPPPFFDRAATKRELRDAAGFSRGLTYADLVRC